MIANLQFAVFTNGPPPSAAEALNGIAGVSLQSFNQASPIQSTSLGRLNDVIINVEAQPTRIDFVLQTHDSRLGPMTPQTLDVTTPAVLAARIAVSELAERLLAYRVAVIMTALEAVSTPQETVQLASKALPNLPIPANATEVDYKFNSPSTSAVNTGITINRLHRWASMGITFMQIGPTGATQLPVTWHLAQTIDFNTSQETHILPAQSNAHFDELFDLVLAAHQSGFGGY